MLRPLRLAEKRRGLPGADEACRELTGTEGGVAEAGGFESAELSVSSEELAADIARLQSDGYRLDLIRPADNPTQALMSRRGQIIRLQVGDADAGEFRSDARGVDEIAASALRQSSGGSTLEDADLRHSPEVSYPGTLGGGLTISRLSEAEFGVGRAGMAYRDLVPGRNGGRVIASHIRIDEGGRVADYVHYHDIGFQVIFCVSGWVEVVYEDQGPPFRLLPGDCVLQPPGIRHRVLRCSPGLEVVEIGSPAVHDTRVDHELRLPNDVVQPEREFGGQRFVRHQAAAGDWDPCGQERFELRHTGVAAGSRGAGSVDVIRLCAGSGGYADFGYDMGANRRPDRETEFVLGFVLGGSCDVNIDADESGYIEKHHLLQADSFVLSGVGSSPTERRCSLNRCSDDFELLVVKLPAQTPCSTGPRPRQAAPL